MQLGMTQRGLAKAIGVTAQQVQKYESGTNALRVSRLMQFSQALNCPIENFLLIIDKTYKSSEGVLQESASTFTAEPTSNSNMEILPEEIDNFFVKFLSLSCENQSNVIKIVNALAASDSSHYKKKISCFEPSV
jgi:transcriptional regulator with XRE-family HTH domain